MITITAQTTATAHVGVFSSVLSPGGLEAMANPLGDTLPQQIKPTTTSTKFNYYYR